MRYGHRQQYEKLLAKAATDKDRVNAFKNNVRWITEEWWYLPEDGDGEAEQALLARLAKASKGMGSGESKGSFITPLTISGSSRREKPDAVPSIQSQAQRKSVPSVKQPPFLGKVWQYLKTVTGPRVTPEVVERRLQKCTVEGGWAFAPCDGVVVAVGSSFVQIDYTVVQLPTDESPVVEVGQTVLHGQPISKSQTAKACPLLQRKGAMMWCNGCGCGERAEAELRNKLTYARAKCPRSPALFEPEDEHGPTIQT